MLDQSFSNTNFNNIFLQDNRKGVFNKTYFTKEYLDKHEEFKNIIKEKTLLKETNGILTKEELDGFSEKLEKINNQKEEIRLNIFKEFEEKLSEKSFCFEIDYNPAKQVFTVERDATSYYAIKQLQININKIFKVIQANRSRIIKQLFHILSDGYPKILIKTDIKSFYESIPQDKLFSKIDDNSLLSPFSKNLLRKLFYQFEQIKAPLTILNKKGIPRGIGVSAYLSELYMRDIDNEIKSIDDVIYFARYVDDIVVIFSPKTPSTKINYLEIIKNIICQKNSLQLKDGTDGEPSKTFEIELPNKGDYNKEVSFLGYRFLISRKETIVKNEKKVDFRTKIEISENKINKYIERLKKSVEAYNIDSNFNEKESRKLLFERLKFLTGNFHLNNTKRSVKSGIYYSNQMLALDVNSGFESLQKLDKELSNALKSISPPAKIGINKTNLKLHILSKYNFKKGFTERKKYFYSFNLSSKEIKYYFKKYGKGISKFEIIKFIWK